MKEDVASTPAAADSKQSSEAGATAPAAATTTLPAADSKQSSAAPSAASSAANDKLPVFELTRNLSAVLDVLGRKEQELRAASGVQAERYAVKPHSSDKPDKLSKPKLNRAQTINPNAGKEGADGKQRKPTKQKLSVIDRILLARNA